MRFREINTIHMLSMTTKPVPYVPVGLRSYFSLLRGCLSPEELCALAARRGWEALCLTDIHNFYGLVRFIRAAREEGVLPLCGTAFFPVPHGLPGEKAIPLFTALCIDGEGYARINEILTKSFHYRADPKEGMIYDPVEDLRQGGWKGLWIVSSRKEVLERLRGRRAGRGEGRKEQLYAGLVFGRPYAGFVRWAKKEGLPLFALNEGFRLKEEDLSLHHLLRAVDLRCTVDMLPPEERGAEKGFTVSGSLTGLPGVEGTIAGEEEVRSFFSAVPEALENSLGFRMAALSAEKLLPQNWVFPRFQGLDGEEEFRQLRGLCLAGITRRYGNSSPVVEKRLSYELEIIRKKGFAGYFLVVWDIVKRCPRTCGRGSAAASIVSYLLGITHVEPLSHNLFFERFLNMGRKDPPDIDVDFPWDEREKALSYVFETYPGRAGMVADHVTFAFRSSLREAAAALGAGEEEIKKIVRFARYGDDEKIAPYIKEAALRLRGLPRYLGAHPGGVVITPGPINRYTHLQPSLTGFPLIAWEKDATEEAGLIKIDLLGNRSLGVLRDTIRLINRGGKHRLEWESFSPLKDRGTRDLIERGDTLGVFYVESPATRQLLKKMRSGSFENLVIASSIIRPAANRFINLFVERLHGKPYTPLHPLIRKTLKETKGIMVYQEDVARVAIAVAGFSAAEADGLRKVLSKKDRKRRLKAFRLRFFKGGRRKGISEEVLEGLWEMVLSFEGYSFCKSHSASYALVSYRLAWCKTYYPLEFFVSVINNGGGFYGRQVYLDEARRQGGRVMGPDINKSLWEYSLEYGLNGETIWVGLSQIREFSSEKMEVILRERERRGAYEDIFDFFRRIGPKPAELRVLIRSGALDSLRASYTRPQLFWLYSRTGKEPPLFPPTVPSCIGDYRRETKLKDEVRFLGLLCSRHPLELFRPRVSRFVGRGKFPPLIDSRGLKSPLNLPVPGNRDRAWRGKRASKEVSIPGMVIAGKEVKTRKKEYMSFLSFEDEYGVFETVLFPDIYSRFFRLFDEVVVFLVVGRITEEFGVPILEVRELHPLNRRSRIDNEEISGYLRFCEKRGTERQPVYFSSVESRGDPHLSSSP